MDREPATWSLVCTILRNHVKPDHDCEETVNRLWTKGVSERRPRIAEARSTVYLEKWSLGRLWALIKETQITDLAPRSENDPPIVVRWKGVDHRIDGRRRINKLKRRGDEGPHSVLIVDIGDV